MKPTHSTASPPPAWEACAQFTCVLACFRKEAWGVGFILERGRDRKKVTQRWRGSTVPKETSALSATGGGSPKWCGSRLGGRFTVHSALLGCSNLARAWTRAVAPAGAGLSISHLMTLATPTCSEGLLRSLHPGHQVVPIHKLFHKYYLSVHPIK